MLSKILKTPDLRNKVAFTLLMLFIYRIGSFIPVPGINSELLRDMSSQGDMLSFLNTFSGGALQNFSLFAVGIMPYITASIIIQLLSLDVHPTLTEWSKQGEYGQKKIKKLTRYMTVGLALVQSLGMAFGFNKMYPGLVSNPTVGTYIIIALTLTLGTIILMVMGELITKKGIGNGISVIIFAGIVALIPQSLTMLYATEIQNAGDALFINIVKLALLGLALLGIMMGVIYIQKAIRKIPIRYSKEGSAGGKVGTSNNHLPIPLNIAGVIPVIFASSLFMFPPTVANFFGDNKVVAWIVQTFDYTKPLGMLIFAILIMAFTYFYTFVQFSPEKMSTNLKNQGSFVPGIRPGKPTEEYLSDILKRLSLVGATFLAILSALPILFMVLAQLPQQVQIGGVSLIIVVSVALEITKHIQTNSLKSSYRGFSKKK